MSSNPFGTKLPFSLVHFGQQQQPTFFWASVICASFFSLSPPGVTFKTSLSSPEPVLTGFWNRGTQLCTSTIVFSPGRGLVTESEPLFSLSFLLVSQTSKPLLLFPLPSAFCPPPSFFPSRLVLLDHNQVTFFDPDTGQTFQFSTLFPQQSSLFRQTLGDPNKLHSSFRFAVAGNYMVALLVTMVLQFSLVFFHLQEPAPPHTFQSDVGCTESFLFLQPWSRFHKKTVPFGCVLLPPWFLDLKNLSGHSNSFFPPFTFFLTFLFSFLDLAGDFRNLCFRRNGRTFSSATDLIWLTFAAFFLQQP